MTSNLKEDIRQIIVFLIFVLILGIAIVYGTWDTGPPVEDEILTYRLGGGKE